MAVALVVLLAANDPLSWSMLEPRAIGPRASVGVPLGGSPPPPSDAMAGAPRPAATTDTIYVDGYSPTALALHWDTTRDLCFDHYAIQESNVSGGGPWTTVWTTTDSARYEFMAVGFGPGNQSWWRDIDFSGCAGGQAASNVVNITNPAVATLSYGDSSASSILLAWTNSAHYYGLLAFASYVVMKAAGSGGFSPIATITSAATTTFTDTGLTGLDVGAHYRYVVVTNENCTGVYCGGLNATTSSRSNSVAQLSLTVPVATPPILRVNESTSLQVSVWGGSAPYRYGWSGLPGGCVLSDSNPLACTPTEAGSFNVSVTVSDARGVRIVSRALALRVDPTSSPANGSGNGSGAAGTTRALPPYVLLGLAVAGTAAVVGLALLLVRRRRRRKPMPSIAFAPVSGEDDFQYTDPSGNPPMGRYR